jgi:hypothetical protein
VVKKSIANTTAVTFEESIDDTDSQYGKKISLPPAVLG